jgi:cation-transporting P-type ATPase C
LNDLNALIDARQLSLQKLRTAEFNFRLALLTDPSGIILAAVGMLPPVFAGMLHLFNASAILSIPEGF